MQFLRVETFTQQPTLYLSDDELGRAAQVVSKQTEQMPAQRHSTMGKLVSLAMCFTTKDKQESDFMLIMSFEHYFGGEGRYHAGRALTRIVSPCLRHWEYFSEQQVLTST